MTGRRGRSHVTRGTMTAVTLNFLLKGLMAEMLKLVTDWMGDLCVRPATPEIRALKGERGRESDLARRSVMNEDEDAESSRARASMVEPSEASTATWQVMSSELGGRPVTA